MSRANRLLTEVDMGSMSRPYSGDDLTLRGDADASRVFNRVRLVQMLSEILGSDDQLETIAARSYLHDNGFLKLVLAHNRRRGSALRLHVWPDGMDRDCNIHNHCWSFASTVILGTLNYEEYLTDASGDVEAMSYSYLNDGGIKNESLGWQRLRLVASGVRAPGDSYAMRGTTLHRTWAAAEGLGATLVVQGNRERQHANVYVKRGHGIRNSAARAMTSARLLRLTLTEVLDRLE